MLIHEVCKECSLTKKAVEYYIEQELVFPEIQQNGYRSFSDEDVLILKKISILRSLGVSIADIRDVLSGETAAVLYEIYSKKTLQISALREKQELIRELAEKHDWEQVQGRLRQLQKKQTIMERLMDIFPGNYGRYICLHFAPYLAEPVLTDAQQEAFDNIISFLDGVDFDIPDDLKEYLEEITLNFDAGFVENMSAGMNDVICETEKYIAEHQKEIESYIAYRQSEEYKAAPIYRLEKALRQFYAASGYNDIFIPEMCRLSESYRKYHEGLLRADEKLLQMYPEYYNNWNLS